jgi:energy-coupling factor transporter ATP-binding protein EcfA2
VTEKIERLVLRSFRGVPGEMALDLAGGQSLAVYGDNGTGKSTIADALEWFFTGGIELLSHEGRQHAVRNLGAPPGGETSVEIATTGELGGKAVFPDARGPEAFALAGRETFLLRGRTLADFINKTKTEKWKALAELLGLDAIEALRLDLQRVRTDLKKQVKTADEQIAASRRAVSGGDAAASEAAVLESLQQVCRALGVAVPDALDGVADPSWIAGVVAESGPASAPRVEALVQAASALVAPRVDGEVVRAWNEIGAGAQAGLSRLAFFQDADALLAAAPGESCPLCGQSVTADELAARVRDTLAGLLDSARATDAVREGIEGLRDDLARSLEARLSLAGSARALRIKLPDLPELPPALSTLRERPAAVDLASVAAFTDAVGGWDEAARTAIRTSVPEGAATRPAQLAMLAAIADHIRSWRAAEAERAQAERALDLADRIYEGYQSRQKKQLEEVLTRISRRVAELYAELHPGENLAGITVEPWTAKGLELAVEFYGSKQRPPHGVLSESHLNSLAIALFLAMAQTFNQKLRFLVLDDVVNSFDLEHRGELASLLAEKFDDWQLVVLTHDRQFFDHLARRAPSWRRLELTSWSFEQGPRTTRYESAGLVAEARGRLGAGDVSGAATKARRGLEELLLETCEALAAALPFRRGARNDQRELGELLKGVRRAVKEHAKGLLGELEPLLKHIEADVQATLNPEAHASRGRSGTAEVEASLKRLEQLDRMWSCPECGTRLWHKGTPESSRCKCGKSVFPPPPP